MTSERLTKAQRELLTELPTTCAEHYPPARKLVSAGLAEWVLRDGHIMARLEATPAGRAMLSEGE
jgi:hypothetical protein